MFKINFGLEVQPYLLFQFGPIWGLFLPFLGSTGLFFGLRSGSKTLLRPTNVDNLLQSYISFLILLHFEPFLPFLGPLELFLRLGSASAFF